MIIVWLRQIRASKIYHERVLSIGFAWNKNDSSEATAASNVNTVRKSICKMKHEKAMRSSGLLLVMVESTREAGIDMITNLWY